MKAASENMWDDRYSGEEYFYGTKPNEFFKQEIDRLKPGTILLPCEGEGRNALYAAQTGWNVYAFDGSIMALKKAMALAEAGNLRFSYRIEDVQNFTTNADYDVAALIYVHLPEHIRRSFHSRVEAGIRKDGLLILEAFSKNQLGKESGGPRDRDMLYSTDIISDFKCMRVISAGEECVMLNEGKGHRGQASVIRLVLKKM